MPQGVDFTNISAAGLFALLIVCSASAFTFVTKRLFDANNESRKDNKEALQHYIKESERHYRMEVEFTAVMKNHLGEMSEKIGDLTEATRELRDTLKDFRDEFRQRSK